MKLRITICLYRLLLILPAIVGVGCGDASAQSLNDCVLNRPYADMRRWHLGFSVGIHTQDITFSHNGLITAEGEEWYMEQPGFSPGFCVNGLVDMRLNSLMNLRFTPGLYFGNRGGAEAECENDLHCPPCRPEVLGDALPAVTPLHHSRSYARIQYHAFAR